MRTTTMDSALKTFSCFRSVFSASDAISAGVHPRVLYNLRDEGVVEQISRGLYRLSANRPLQQPDLVTVVARAPHAVVFLLSALSFHELTTQIPRKVQIAIERGATAPRIDYPPVKVFWRTHTVFSEGIETREIDGIKVRFYSPEKSIVDAFQYRNKIGLDVALEALRLYRDRGRINVDAITRFAKTGRVWNNMLPYVEAIL